MAIQMDCNFKGVPIKSAYVRCTSFSGNKTWLMAHVTFHVNSAAEEFSSMDISVPYVLDGGNPIAQVYTHMKTLPEFANAQDC